MTDWITPVSVLTAGGAIAAAALTFSARMSRREPRKSGNPGLKIERDHIIEQLRDLPAGEDRYELELRAATLWRDLDRKKAVPSRQRSPLMNTLRGFAWGLGSVAAIALLFVLVQRNSQSAPTETQKAPDFLSAMTEDPSRAESLLSETLATEPDRLDAMVHLAVLYAQTGRSAEAISMYEDALRKHPEAAESLAPLRAEIEKLDAPGFAGILELGPNAKFTPGQVVYVIARSVEGGPPVAVERIEATSFPLPFTLRSGHSMTGEALPDKVRVEARLDSDGDAITKPASDPSGLIEQVALGSRDLRITLQ